MCRNPGSNQGPLDLQSNALPTELFRQLWMLAIFVGDSVLYSSDILAGNSASFDWPPRFYRQICIVQFSHSTVTSQ